MPPPTAVAPPPDPRYASSLAHGLALLEGFAGGPAALTNKQLAQRSGLSKASVSRLTTTLASRGLVVFDPVTQKHRLGPATLTLAHPLLVSLGVRRLARLPMKQLSDELAGTVSLGMRDRRRMVYVETSRSNVQMAFRPDVGAVFPMLQSAIGRAWLAAAPDDDRAEVLRTLRAEAPADFRHWSGAATQARLDLARQGYCVSRGDWRAEVSAVAVPLDITLDGERLVLNCGLPTRRLGRHDLDRLIAPRLLQLARQIEIEWRTEVKADAERLPTAMPQAPRVRPSEDASDRQFARTLARGIDLLMCFQPGDGALGNGELARRLGLSGPTVVRLTHTLVVHGYLRRDASSTRYPCYRLGAAALSVAYPMVSNLELREQARPAMLALAERVGGSVSLGLRHQLGMVYVDNAWRTDGRLVPPDTGTLMPMLASAMGRAWLSRADPAERSRVLNQIRVHDPHSWMRYAEATAASVHDFKRLGYCWSRDVRPEVEAFGVPFSRAIDGTRYVMNCGVLAPKPLSEMHARAVGAALVDTVRNIEGSISGHLFGKDA